MLIYRHYEIQDLCCKPITTSEGFLKKKHVVVLFFQNCAIHPYF